MRSKVKSLNGAVEFIISGLKKVVMSQNTKQTVKSFPVGCEIEYFDASSPKVVKREAPQKATAKETPSPAPVEKPKPAAPEKPKPAPTQAQPASGTVAATAVEDIKKLKELLDLGLITQEEFDAKKKQLLGL